MHHAPPFELHGPDEWDDIVPIVPRLGLEKQLFSVQRSTFIPSIDQAPVWERLIVMSVYTIPTQTGERGDGILMV